MNTRSDTSLVLLATVVLVAGFAAGRSGLFRPPESPAHLEHTALTELDHGDGTDAFAMMRKSAEKGDASAAYHLGMMYEDGQGTAPDAGRAIDWLTRAAHAGSTAAASRLGTLYLRGTDVVQNFSEARSWFTVAAKKGDRAALRQLGEMNAEGFGAPVDLVKAYAYYAAATARGSIYDAALRDRVAARLDPQEQIRGETEAQQILAGIELVPDAGSKIATASAATPSGASTPDRTASAAPAAATQTKAVN